MKYTCTTFLTLLFIHLGFSQQYNTVFMEKDSIDSNNEVYKIGNVFVFDYEIIQNGSSKKLKTNSRHGFDLVTSDSDSLGVEKIHLIVRPSDDASRTNTNQTEISYLEGPQYGSFSSTGAVDNDKNVWIHPIREGFFESLEACPFPYIK